MNLFAAISPLMVGFIFARSSWMQSVLIGGTLTIVYYLYLRFEDCGPPEEQ